MLAFSQLEPMEDILDERIKVALFMLMLLSLVAFAIYAVNACAELGVVR